MIIQFENKHEETGDSTFKLQFTASELNFLVTFAIESLINIGAIAVDQASAEPQVVEIPEIPGQPIVPPEQVN